MSTSYRERFINDQKKALMDSINNFSIKSQHTSDIITDEFSDNFKSEISHYIDRITLKNLYFTETWIFIIVNVVARKIAKQFLKINRDSFENGKVVTNSYDDHLLLNLFWNPNEYEGYTSFMYKLACELTLMGNAIIWRLKFHKQLFILPTEAVTIEFDKNGKIKWYLVNFGNIEEFSTIYNGSIKIHPNDIIHIKQPHLNSVLWGFSPLISAGKSIMFERYTKEFLLNFYIKQANPGPILEMTELANEKQALRLLKSIEQSYTGRTNQRRTMILPKGITAKNLMQTMAEQQLKEHLLINRDDLRAIYAIPPHELGLQQSGSIGSNETKEMIKNFYEQTIIPYQNLISDEFTRFFQKELGTKYYFTFDNSNISALKDDEKSKAELAVIQMNFKSINEVRADLYDLPPVAGGEKISTINQYPNFNNNFMSQQTDTNYNNQNLIENQELENQELENQELENQENTKQKYESWWIKRKSNEDTTINKSERIVLTNVLDIFMEQAYIAVDKFKTIYKDKIKENGIYSDEDRLRTELQDAFNKFEEDYYKGTVKTLVNTSNIGYNLHLDVPFNIPSKNEIIAIGSRNEDNRNSLMEARALKNFQGFNETTTNDIINTIKNGINESKTLDEISKLIVDYFGEYAPNRAKTIARTETLLAVSMGQKAAEEDAIELIPGLKKQWITANDDRVRDSHNSLDGVTIKANESWKTSTGAELNFPRDPSGPASETINCRCTWLMIPPDDI